MAVETKGICGSTGVSNENPLIIGIMENSEVIETFRKIFDITLEVVLKQTNHTCYMVNDIPLELLGINNPNIYIPDINILYLTSDTSVFGRLKYFVNSAWINTPDTYLISKPPEKYETIDSSSLIACDDGVKLAIIIVLLLVTLFTTFASLIISGEKSFQKLFLRYLWEMVTSLSRQAMENISRYWSNRILIGSWLLGSLVIGIYISSFLSSNLSVIGYTRIDSVSDLITSTKIQPVVIKNLNEYLMMQYKAEFDDVAKKFIEIVDKEQSFVTIDDLISDQQFYRDIRDGKKALIVHKLVWISLFDLVQGEESDFDFYYGEESLSSGVMTAFFNRSVSVSDQEIMNHVYVYSCTRTTIRP